VFAADDWIYYQHGIDRTLWRVSPDGGSEEQVLNVKPYSGRFVFSPTGTRAAFVDGRSGTPTVTIISIPSGRELASLELVSGKGRLELAWLPDESAIAYTSSELEGELHTLWFQSIEGGPPQSAATLGEEEIRFLAFTPHPDSIAFVQGGWKHDMVLLSGLQ
jgi:Tol biopolymer transport system component